MTHQSYCMGFLFRNTGLSGLGRQTSLQVNRNDTTVSSFVDIHSGGRARKVGPTYLRFTDALSYFMWSSSDDTSSTTVSTPNTFLWLTPLKCPWKSRAKIWHLLYFPRRSKWPRGLRRGSSAVRLLGLQVRIPPGAWMSVSVSWECYASG